MMCCDNLTDIVLLLTLECGVTDDLEEGEREIKRGRE